MRIVTTTYQDEFLKLGRLLDSQFKSDPEAQAWCPGAGKEKLLNVCKLIWAIEHL
jgi:hypothetical protein